MIVKRGVVAACRWVFCLNPAYAFYISIPCKDLQAILVLCGNKRIEERSGLPVRDGHLLELCTAASEPAILSSSANVLQRQ